MFATDPETLDECHKLMDTFPSVDNIMVNGLTVVYKLMEVEDAEQQAEADAAKSEASDCADGAGEEDGDGEGKPKQIKLSEAEADLAKLLEQHSHEDREDDFDINLEPLDYSSSRVRYNPHPLSDLKRETPSGGAGNGIANGIRTHLGATTSMKGTVRREFQTVSQNRKRHNQKRGRLETNRLGRAASGNLNIFSKKIKQLDKNADVYLLVDMSGSMRGSKLSLAGTAVIRWAKHSMQLKYLTRLQGSLSLVGACITMTLYHGRKTVGTKRRLLTALQLVAHLKMQMVTV